jgi:hypothetical protein
MVGGAVAEEGGVEGEEEGEDDLPMADVQKELADTPLPPAGAQTVTALPMETDSAMPLTTVTCFLK